MTFPRGLLKLTTIMAEHLTIGIFWLALRKPRGIIFTAQHAAQRGIKMAAKAIFSSKIPSQIYELNMEEKPALDLLEGADVNNLGK